tara:strand:- start:2727 stop:3299 length:573 start_codon:yes stop_codon:yes gene_type:complete
MPNLTISTSSLKNADERNKIINKPLKRKIINNKVVDTTNFKSKDSVTISNAKDRLDNKGLTIPSETKTSPAAIAEEVLSSIGCTSITEEEINRPDYSLISVQTDTDTLDNPNKLDHKQFTNIKKANVSLDGILKSDNDSIYYLDEDVPDNYKKQMKKSKLKNKVPLTNVASRIVQINNGSGNNNTLRNLK